MNNMINPELIVTQIERDLIEMPIKNSMFPHFVKKIDDDSFLSSLLNQNNENNNDDSQNYFSVDDHVKFYETLCKHSKPFTFSTNYVNIAVKKFDDFLNSLLESENKDQFQHFKNLDRKSDEFAKYKMILLIKLRLFMNVHRIHDFLIALIQLMLIEEEDENDQFSFKKIFNEILPQCSTRRSTIITKVPN